MLCDSTNITLEQHAHFAMVCHNLCNLLVLFMKLLIIRVGGGGVIQFGYSRRLMPCGEMLRNV